MAEENLGPAAGMDKKAAKKAGESQKKRRKTESKTCEKGSEEKRYGR